MQDIYENLIRLQKICKNLDEEVNNLEKSCKGKRIKSDEDRKRAVFLSEKMNEIRAYLVYQSKQVDCRRMGLRNEITFYDWENKQ